MSERNLSERTLEERVAALETEMALELDLRRLVVRQLVARREYESAEAAVHAWLLHDDAARRSNTEPTK